jgi:putative hemolysin
MSGIGFEILVILVLVVTHGAFVVSEIAMLKARRSQLQESAGKGSAKARIALELATSPNRFLPAVQVGTTLLTIATGVFAGRTIAERLETYLSIFPGMEAYTQTVGLTVVVVVVLYVALIVGQLVPERLARTNPEGIVAVVAGPLHVFSVICSPVVQLLNRSTQGMLRLFGRGTKPELPVTEEEIKNLVQQATEAGVVEESEQEMVEAVFRLGDKNARALMTPRTQIVWFDMGDSRDLVRGKIIESEHSRFPVGTGGLDNVIGVVQAKDLLARALGDEPLDLKACLKQPVFVPRTMPALQVLDLVKRSGSHIALVVDEYGGIEGLLTHHNLLEAIAGEFPLGENPTEPKAVRRHDGSWLLDGMLSVEEFKEIFQLTSLPGEKRDAYQTLGGFLFTQMGRVPSVSDCFEWSDLCFEIVDMDGKRIDKVLVTTAGPSKPSSGLNSIDQFGAKRNTGA